MNFTKIQWQPAENAEELCYWPFLEQIETDTAAKNTDQNTITVTAVNQLHWLPVWQQGTFKTAVPTYSSMTC